jgi:C1A family cysteine protease
MKSFNLLILVGLASLVASVPAPDKASDDMKIFKDFCAKFNKKYSNEAAEKAAMENVLKAYAEIEAHNKLHEQGKKSYRKALNHHSDLSHEEWEDRGLGYIESDEDLRSKRQGDNHEEFPPGPPSVDWREKGLVGDVLNQGPCGSCWAFSTVEVVETVWRRQNNTMTPSPQQLVDCNHNNAFGCKGGNPTKGNEI